MRFVKAVLLVLVLLAIAGAVFVGSGTYDIGADVPHGSITQRAIDLLRNRSIAVHARGIAVPDLEDPKRLAAGAEHYAAMCTGCHLAPGKAESELRRGLYPTPPDLTHVGAPYPAQAFWIIKHGVKLTAMPAWGKTHDDEAIWGLVAFVRKLPQMTPEAYQQATGNAGEHEHHHHGNDAEGHADPDHGEDSGHSHDAHGDGADHDSHPHGA